MVATPSLTLTVTPPGGPPVDYSLHLAWAGANQQLTIQQNFGRQGDTATFPLVEDHAGTPTIVIYPMSQVSLYDNTASENLFAGVANDIILCVGGPTLNEWDLKCTDYTYYADNAVVHGTFDGLTVDQIVISLVQQANCGITAVSTADGGYVAPGPQLAHYVLNYNTLSNAWRQLATLASSSTPYGWYVDENLELHFFDATTAQSSGVTFTTAPTTAGSLTEGHIKLDTQFAAEQDGSSIRNRILVQGANERVPYGSTSKPPTDTWVGNGVQSSWPLRYTLSGTPILEVGGVKQSVTVAQAGTTASGAWVAEQNAYGAWFLVAADAPASGTVLKAWYTYLVPVVAQAQDTASQSTYTGPNGGVFTEYINDSSLTTMEMALARAQRERTEYAFAVDRLTFDTDEGFLGWVRAGETCTVNNTLVYDFTNHHWGVDDTYITTGNTVTFGPGGYRTMQIAAVRV